MGSAVLLDTDDLLVIDTEAMPWEANPGIPDGRMKTLARAEAGWTEVLVNWLPPDIGGGEPHRHYHLTVRERGFVLDGELPMVEFIAGDAGPGSAVLFRRGFFMDRAPGCIHGLDPRSTSPSGFTILEWRDGTGTYLLEEEAATESVVESAPAEVVDRDRDPRPGVVVDRDDLSLLDVLELPWDVPESDGATRVQRLSGANDADRVTIAYVPAGERDQALLGDGEARRGYVLSGGLELAGGVLVGAGGYLERRGSAAVVAVAREIGCRLLRF